MLQMVEPFLFVLEASRCLVLLQCTRKSWRSRFYRKSVKDMNITCDLRVDLISCNQW